MQQTVLSVFKQCVLAIRTNVLIRKVSTKDKEFHFQNWFEDRLRETNLNYEIRGRNTYPDFSMVGAMEGYEVKGLAYPGRTTNLDSNSQVPTGFHNGRSIYYVFGRYPGKTDSNEYPLIDLVICHGDFLNADHDYKHKNKSIKGFGSYGDILIRDRKMYVVPTPFFLAEGLTNQQTLILPANIEPDDDFFEVGVLVRVEAEKSIIGYSFNLQSNEILPQQARNPTARTKHIFRAWRLKGSPNTPVTSRPAQSIIESLAEKDSSVGDESDE